jgi:hypothetical protein
VQLFERVDAMKTLEIFLESPAPLQTIATETEATNGQARELVANLSDAQLNWQPAPDSWSMAQCLEHLTVTNREYEPFYATAIARGRERWPIAGPVRYRPTWMGGWLSKQLLPQSTRKLWAPKVFRPAESNVMPGALDRFLKQQSSFLQFVRDAEGFDYNKSKLRSPATPLMRFSLADALVISVVHCWRHLAQAGRVRQASGFPVS